MIKAELVSKIRVSDARAELSLSQRELADRAGVAVQVIVNAEKGREIRRLSAHAILRTLNQERATRNLLPLTIDQLDWEVQ